MDLETIQSHESSEDLPKFQTPFNFVVNDRERNKMRSMTQPGQDMSVSEIRARFASGRPVERNENMLYTGEVYIPNINRMDLTEQAELRDRMNENINKIRNEIEKVQKEQAELLKKEQEEYIKFRDEFRKSQQKPADQAGDSTIQS